MTVACLVGALCSRRQRNLSIECLSSITKLDDDALEQRFGKGGRLGDVALYRSSCLCRWMMELTVRNMRRPRSSSSPHPHQHSTSRTTNTCNCKLPTFDNEGTRRQSISRCAPARARGRLRASRVCFIRSYDISIRL